MITKYTRQFKVITISVVFIAVTLLMNSCNLFKQPQKDPTANDYIYSAFEEWYLWYDQLPDVDPNDYDTQKDLINAIKVAQDRWSFSGSLTEIMKLFEGGEYTGFGAGFMVDFDNQIKISKVYKNSPLGRLGVERGWIVNSINGYGSDNVTEVNNALNSDGDVEFVLTDFTGEQHDVTVQREAIIMNTVLYSSIIETEGHKIGYLVFDSFLDVSEAELITEFQKFQDQGITDLIVDLRYNGGGANTIAYELIGMIGGDKVAGQVISQTILNDKKSDRNSSEVSEYDGPKVDIGTVYFITTSGSASASELVINDLEPFMDVKLVGSQTHGKPVGMYILQVEELDLAILPISFKNVNHDGYGDYYDGLPVDISEVDDLTRNWGDTDEKMLKAAIADITGATTVATTMKSAKINQQRMLDYTGYHQIINAY